MITNQSLSAIIDDAHEAKTLKELAQSPPSVFHGLSDAKAKLLQEALGVRTVEDLATSKYVLWAQAIAQLARHEKPAPMRKAA